jgi:hypothetical protein
MPALSLERLIFDVRTVSAFPPIVLQNSKMRWRQNFAARPSKRVFSDPMSCTEVTKVAGRKTD